MKNKLGNAIFLILSIVLTISTAIFNVRLIPVVCGLCIIRFGLNIGSIITVVGCIYISQIMLSVKIIKEIIRFGYFRKK